MSESRDTEIKLFGRTISSLYGSNHDPSSSPVSTCPGVGDHGRENSLSSSSSCSPSLRSDKMKKRIEDDNGQDSNSNLKDPQMLSDLNGEPNTASETSSKNNGDQHSEITTTTSCTSQEKPALKKPDKILPCPRCKSADTKFCYYNNYNVNQPRHFCKNCQRYWTAGGSMRNVPVGSGRRKNKGWASSSSSNPFPHIRSSEDDDSNNENNSSTILNFGSSEYMISDPGKDRTGEAKITPDSPSHELHYQQGFLAPQVTFPIPPTWPYRWNPAIPNPNFYPIPFYWGCSVPVWSPTTSSTCVGKRSRDPTPSEDVQRRRFVSETKPEKTGQDKFSLFNGFEPKTNHRTMVSESSSALHANPAALARSLTFRESNTPTLTRLTRLNGT